MKTILVANTKGGCGKTTIATTLASALSLSGERATLIDADPQRSSLGWIARRSPQERAIQSLDWTRPSSENRFRLRGEAKREWRLIDAPGGLDAPAMERLAAISQLVIVPVAPSSFDMQATQAFLMRLEDVARRRRKDAGVVLVATRANKRLRATKRLLETLERIDARPVGVVGERAAYTDLASRGLSVFDRRARSLAPLRAQWAPVLQAIGAKTAERGKLRVN